MGNIMKFNKELSLWFNARGISNLEFCEGEDFCYYPYQYMVQYALLEKSDPKSDLHFCQFFDEYGLEYVNVHPFVLSLLHEVGHYMTIHYFTKNEWDEDTVMKSKEYNGTIEDDYWYWELPIEFEANMWAINWINTHIDDVIELTHLCSIWLDRIYDAPNVCAQIEEWQQAILAGEYYPLEIVEDD